MSGGRLEGPLRGSEEPSGDGGVEPRHGSGEAPEPDGGGGVDAGQASAGEGHAAGPLPEASPAVIGAAEPARPGWAYRDVAVVAGFSLGAQVFVYLFAVLGMLLVRQSRGATFGYLDAVSSVAFILPVQVLWWALVFWIVYRIVRARDPRPFREAIGWVRPSHPAPLYLLGGAGLAASVAVLAWALPKSHQKMPMEALFKDPMSAFLLAGFGVFVAPVVEELLFRGFLYPVMERAHGAVAAVVATGGLFSVVHAQQYGWAWQNLLLLGYVGVVFGAVRALTGSLVPSTLVHASYNLTLFAALYGASKGFRNFNF